MSDSKRISYQVYMSCEADCFDDVRIFITERLSRRFGGVTWSRMGGCWVDGAHETKSIYEGRLMDEDVLALFLSVLPCDAEEALTYIRVTARDAVAHFNLQTRYLHIEGSETQALHTDLSNL